LSKFDTHNSGNSYKSYYRILNPLNANVVHARHDADVACSGCRASHRQIIKNDLLFFLKKEKICYKMVYYTFAFKLGQSSEIALQS